jgi:hypothetical protein
MAKRIISKGLILTGENKPAEKERVVEKVILGKV